MIDKIKGLIEDNTEIDVTRNQIKLALFVVVSLVTLIVIFLFQSSTGPQKDTKNTAPTPSDFSSGNYRQQ